MAELKQKMAQKMTQKLSPQQIQLMKLLQVPTYALEQRIQEEMEANPALEEDQNKLNEEYNETEVESGESEIEDNYELDDYLEEYMEEDPSSYRYQSGKRTMDESDRRRLAVSEDTLHDHLMEQLGMLNITDKRKLKIAEQIIGSIDEDGYLRREPISIIDDLMFSQNIEASEEEILILLEKIQKFDPVGIGARSLQECLLIQLEKIRADEKYEEEPVIEIAHTILTDHFDAFSKKHYNKLTKALDLSDEELKEIIDYIVTLNPKPASAFSNGGSNNDQYILPDFIIQNRDGELVLSLNGINAPELHVNHQYQNMLKTYKDQKKSDNSKPSKKNKEAVVFIKRKIDSARWFIDAIRQRQQTMYKTMYAIMQYQYDYFTTGDDSKIKPMILKDIAEVTGLDISTISRVVSSKYVQTEFGTKHLKGFFSESMEKKNGEEVSTLEIKHLLKKVVENENKRKPLSDQKIMQALKDKGYKVARRTVAKYREQLSIPVARLRKEL
jgi:RNA polymerase sigma-54 factor